MGVLSSLSTLLASSWDLLVLIAWLFWQGIAERYIPHYRPLLGSIISAEKRLKRIDKLEERFGAIQDRLDDLNKKQTHHIQVTRANSRALDEDRAVTVDSDAADQYLVSNGVPIAELTEHHTDSDDSE